MRYDLCDIKTHGADVKFKDFSHVLGNDGVEYHDNPLVSEVTNQGAQERK